MTHPYEDILHIARPASRRVPMERGMRAKQFMPFAALTGYEDELADKRLIFAPQPVLGEDERDALDEKIRAVVRALERGEKPRIALTYFLPMGRRDENGVPLGVMRTASGTADKIMDGRIRADGAFYPLKDITVCEIL